MSTQIQISSSGAASGVWGISNASGVYTYYATLTLAMAAASSGQTIELFADVIDSTSTPVTLKSGVNIQGNGYSYTHTNGAGTTFILTNTSGTSGNYNFTNINIKRVVTSTTGVAIFTNTNSAPFFHTYNLQFNGSTVEYTWTTTSSPTGLSDVFNSGVFNYDGLNATTNGTGYFLPINGIIRNSKIENTGAGSCIATANAVTTLENLYLKTVSGNCLFMFYGSQSIRNSTAITTSGFAIAGQSGASAYDCYAFSNTGSAFNGVTAHGCTGQTFTGNAFYACNTYTCSGRSTAGTVVTPWFNISNNYNGSFYSSGGIVCNGSGSMTASFYNCSLITDWDTPSAHAVLVGNAYGNIPVFVNNYIKVFNYLANCLRGTSGSINARWTGNKFSTAATPVNANLIQNVINTQDNQGNLLI